MSIPGQVQLVQPVIRPTLAIGHHNTLIGGNLLRATTPLPGIPTGLIGPMQAIPIPGMPSGAMPGVGVVLPASHPMLQMMQPRFR